MFAASTLAHELTTAKAFYIQTRDHFIGLSSLYSDTRDRWGQMDRNPRKNGKETQSVYRHRKSKGQCVKATHRR
jgi:hypothetical protein